MPIMLDDISSISNKVIRAVTPHFFSTMLTGRGGTQGVINQNLKPGRYDLGQSAHTMPLKPLNDKSKSSSNGVTIRTIPMGPLTPYSQRDSIASGNAILNVPSSAERFHVTPGRANLDFDVYVDLTPQGTVLKEDGSGDKMIRHLDVLYRMEVFLLASGSSTERVRIADTVPRPLRLPDAAGKLVPQEFAFVGYSFAPLDDIEAMIDMISVQFSPTGQGVHVDVAGLATWMSDYDLYDRICRQAEIWSSAAIGEAVAEHVENLFAQSSVSDPELNRLAAQLRYLENYTVPLEAYRVIYDAIRRVAPAQVADVLAKQNMNLLMNGTMAALEDLKPQLAVPPFNPQAIAALPSKFSAQQREAITTAEPLSLTTAGAGTGKSTTILARIDYLTACGIDPKEITVLSFTNAAADNILAKNPKVGSMTISRMVLDIYKLNHPTHQVSTIDTMVNTLDIFYPNDDMVRAFRRRLIEVDKNQDGATTALNAFVEQHFDAVMTVLNSIEQTCLELQIIIAYQQIDQMAEPPHLAGKFLIVDEVQDNSIFEFVYLLRYVTKHKQNMFIVGDASQTLYEFRSANPKALNALEGSGVFKTYKLTTNYRSNQEILDFANVHLADIEANALSQIRLQANSLSQPTAKSFQEKVQLKYCTAQSQKSFKEDLPGYMLNVVKPYVDACLARGEKVAFLSYKKTDLQLMQASLEKFYPGQQIADITSKRRRPTTIFSQYVKLFWNDVKQVQPGDASLVIYKGITDNLDQIAGRSAATVRTFIQKIVSDWWIAQGPTVDSWVRLFNQGSLKREEFFDRLMRNILDYEIDQNGLKQMVLNQQNRQRKEQNNQGNANLIMSTIHGAKGLEFDNVVVLHQYDTVLPEDQKRMFYVAFTRAMKSELVLSFGKQKNAAIETDYQLIVNALERRERIDLLRKQGLNLDAMSAEEVEAALSTLMTEEAQDAAPTAAVAPINGTSSAPTNDAASAAVPVPA
ncbi:UvrD-helicase domain-containing protein [Arthrobacter bambusae]|uniref:DNA 3'-5' helicase n=1 Tax=Arthrobacter bambusae TaxID=1338426 RepID=A0AAW8D655_9MICC|nr:ATP-dependent helicase [Arthrobacter bambusae]MDP9903185.1 DNA helicase-2/ATP-dependent DNA helicase PcrA [Arthrobacter bambusae]MDQ0128821.1 DNA helicase-2/ATP-dependent DNA helicase PcrA [Arthrobacter bambusae]MDQ0180162.1 DNA helicase-2/ATP-dependent DNA helicase PcrA [Arthrobacter bambusae]